MSDDQGAFGGAAQSASLLISDRRAIFCTQGKMGKSLPPLSLSPHVPSQAATQQKCVGEFTHRQSSQWYGFILASCSVLLLGFGFAFYGRFSLRERHFSANLLSWHSPGHRIRDVVSHDLFFTTVGYDIRRSRCANRGVRFRESRSRRLPRSGALQ